MSSNFTSGIIQPPKVKILYVPPEKLAIEYQKSLDEGAPTVQLMIMLEKICRKVSNKWPCKNQIDKESCINYALTKAWEKWLKYDPNRSENLFSFFTTIIMRDLMNEWKRINRFKKNHISFDVLFGGNDNK